MLNIQVMWKKTQYKDKNPNALYHYGCLILNGKIKTSNDYKDAFEIIYKLSLDNNILAQFKLGLCNGLGQRTKKDIKDAFKWYRKAAEQGDCDAQYYLSKPYLKGAGTDVDENKAKYWLIKAHENGHKNAQTVLDSLFK